LGLFSSIVGDLIGSTGLASLFVFALIAVSTSSSSISVILAPSTCEFVRVIIGLGDNGDYEGLKQRLLDDLVRGVVEYVFLGEIPEIRAVVVEVPRHRVEWLEGLYFVKYVEEDHRGSLLEEVQWNIEMINATRVWSVFRDIYGDAAYGYHSAIQVAVVDTGIDYTHPDLQGGVVYCIKSMNDTQVYYKGSNLTECYDDVGHGTHVAGVIGARLDGSGIVGVAPRVQLYAVKVATSTGAYDSDVAKGIIEAVKGPDGIPGTADDADVISISMGFYETTITLYNAIKYAYTNGAVLVAATGNNGTSQPDYPARYPEVIAVGAVDSEYKVPDWSNRNPDVVAPGVNIYTTHPGGGYAYASGTSDAVPHVSGVVAIIQALRLSTGMDKLTPGEVESILTSTALDLGSPGYDAYYGYGLVDAYRAVARALDAVTVTITETITIRQTTTYTVIHNVTYISTTTSTETTTTTVPITTTVTETTTPPPVTKTVIQQYTITQTTTTTQALKTTETTTLTKTTSEIYTTTVVASKTPLEEIIVVGAVSTLIGALAVYFLAKK